VLEHNVKPAEDNAFITDIELHSQGTGDSVVFEYNQREKYNRYDYESFSASANLKFKEKNAVKKELLVQLESFAETFIIRMGSPVKQMSLEHNWNPHNRTDGVHTQTITQLFGLSPSVLTVDFDQYFSNFNVKVYSEATPEIVYCLTGDVSFDSKLEVELVHQIGSEKKELALFSSKVNDHGILGTRLSWKIEDLSAMRSAIQSRYQTVTSQVHYTFQQLVKDLQMSSSKWAAFKNLRPGLRNLASDMAVEAKTFMKDTEEDESLEEILPVLKQIYVHLHLSTEYISSHISFENIGRNTIRVIKATIDNLYTSAGVYYRNLQTYLFDNRRLAGAIQRTIETVSKTLQKFAYQIDQRITDIDNWFNSMTGGSGGNNMFDKIKKTMKNQFVQLHKQIRSAITRSKAIIEEVIFVCWDDLRAEIYRDYPQTRRFIHRNIDVVIQRLRIFVKESDIYDRNVAQFLTMMEDKPMRKTFAQGKSAASVKQWLSSITGNVVVYDLKHGEIQHEVIVQHLRNFITMLGEGYESDDLKISSMTSYFQQLASAIDKAMEME